MEFKALSETNQLFKEMMIAMKKAWSTQLL